MTLLRVSKLAKYYGADLIFGDVSFQVSRGEKVALVGGNGAGKSTLLKTLAGQEYPDEGEVQVARGTRIAYLAQEARFDGKHTLWQEMEGALSHLNRLQAEISALEHFLDDTTATDWAQHMERYAELTARFEHAGGYHSEHTVERTLHRLGFVETHYDQPVSKFSGGQKTRAALAATLLSDPELLLLDEPTNHLDLEAMEWLDSFLKTWPGTLIVVSHDRHFLDKVTQRTFELVLGQIEDYPGGYNRYLKLKAERMERRMKEFMAQQKFIARTEEFIRRYGAGQRSKEAKGREKRLDRLKAHRLLTGPKETSKLNLSLDSQLRSGELALVLDRVEVGFKNRGQDEAKSSRCMLVRAEKLELRRGERVALIGPNGSGKTTLLRTVMGEIPPLCGRLRLGHNVTVGYYAQGHESVRMNATVLQEILRVDPPIGEDRARALLGRFLFSGDDVFKQVCDLSGGERSRVALAQLTLLSTNLLVLDEPTNHLDVESREALEAVLNEYNGSILFVSHDRYFIDALANKLWIISDGCLNEHLGNYSDYVVRLEKERQTTKSEHSNLSVQQTKDRVPRTERKRAGSSSRNGYSSAAEKQNSKRLAALETELVGIEREITKLKAELEAASAAQDVARVTTLGLRYVELQEIYDRSYNAWAELLSVAK